LVEISGRAYEVSEGRFDPTVGAVSRLWQFWDGAQPPAQDSIQAALRRVGFSRYAAGERPSGMLMDLGGVAKGYAADRAAAKLRALGFRSAIINAGGDMRLLGSRPDGKPWRIAIRHPRRQSDFIGFLDLEDISVATSGDYEKFFMYNGKRYHHILDPETGMPGYASAAVTVVAKDAALCDALATGLFLLGPEKGLAVVEAIDGVDAVFVHPDGETVSVSSGLGSRFGGLGAD
jgi:thiamine biosynthesis lipoprotein